MATTILFGGAFAGLSITLGFGGALVFVGARREVVEVLVLPRCFFAAVVDGSVVVVRYMSKGQRSCCMQCLTITYAP